ncbi:AraC family transcriptional regulator [Shewanella sp. MF05960]|uniref:AraC family transcriptional regulator n=1 Tax=Shewanella sp. MF05960 TaxID=3434874 RepID=UPI003D7B9534
MTIPNIGFNHEKTKQAELEIIELSNLYCRPNMEHDPQAPHRVSFFMLIYIKQGEGKHYVDFTGYDFKAGSLIFVQPDQVHSFDFSHQPQGKVLLFTQAFLDKVHANMRLPNYTPTHLNQQHNPLLQLDNVNHARTETLINEILTESTIEPSEPLIVMYLFSALALLLHRLRPALSHDNLSTDQSLKLSKFFSSMQQHAHKVRDANWFAGQIHTTYKTLNNICKLATGLTAKQMIDAYTIIEIKRRLVVSNATTQQLANDFGFDDTSNFVKYFKNQTQLTPSQFSKLNTH